VRRLAALENGASSAADDAFMQRLSGWFDWTDAIALSAALGTPAAGAGAAVATAAGADPRASAHAREAARVRASLSRALAEAPESVDEAEGFSPWRELVLARQQAMENAIGLLRQRLRAALAAGTPAQARVAAIDAVLEQAIGRRERELLATVPRWLERSFERRRRASPPVLAAFRRELVELLQGELDFRMQPVEGLLAALAPSSPESS
jgi:hypothetical protein